MSWLNLGAIVDATAAEGPGVRTAVWVQGCLKRCSSCCNPDFLKIKPANVIEVEQLKKRVEANKKNFGIQGITLLGGEPVLQANGLSELAQFAQSIGLSVMLFTGYELEELDESRFAGIAKLLNHVDVVVDGEFELKHVEQNRNWVGSMNQKFHYLTNRYDRSIESSLGTVTNEWRINAHGQVSANGLPFIVKV
ncbi:4Fe-4S single cluster domain-containing protein [Thalassotalea ponticola]|uniref:4Fe-4S single cluster domain-containing protein n=1 Tax=Thalassotalea ponticola TaxID=1523392 RepID=UPI0025B4F9BF|nr:4Fe-4S single cluster domain-containing protein [Thalassotalea ponticola]MDN3651340.1 4Fe-4S single cluster domain-containing protein [Thalassotalea ponticola]